jgi:hypothetical protein
VVRYVLSPTHLHEYKSADKTQAPVMSLYLPEQKLGSHSTDGSSSNKFVLKGRQTGSMHRGHKWVFRAESHETMMAWYDDIKAVTEQTPEERSNLVRASSRSISRSSQRSSVSSDGVEDDEEPPFTATVSSVGQQQRQQQQDGLSRRPSGGRFPSDLQVNAQRGLQVPVSPLSASSGYGESFNHDPFTTTVPPGNNFGQQAQGIQEVSRARGTERGDFQHATAMDGSVGGPVQFPNSDATAVARGQGLQEPGPSTGQNPPPADGRYGGATWAEPIPIPIPHQVPQVSSARNSEVYDIQGAAVMNGGRNPGMADPRISHDGASIQRGMDGGMVEDEIPTRPGAVARTDSVPTISNLHIPGKYPKGSA